jgi:glucose-6-phosphate 1-dehydrogenase
MGESTQNLTIVVVGASGHLARTKILPALFALYCQGYLPEHFRIIGFARTNLSDDAFRETVGLNLTCRYTPGESCAERMQEFLSRCEYIAGKYDSAERFQEIERAVGRVPPAEDANLLFYLAIPPAVFPVAARAIGEAGLARRGQVEPWTRLVIEKPFGHDRPSSNKLSHEIGAVFGEDQIYRIDHYLGKEVIQNLLVLRFANLVFEPIWNRHYIQSVQITWKENLSIEGRGGYFDSSGIIRDVMQNHLVQILALVAMEPPPRLDATHIRNAKVNALICVPPPSLETAVLGQYTGTNGDGMTIPGYREDPSVPDDSVSPTYAAVALHVENSRWDGVPFLMRAGKGLDGRMTEIRIRFHEIPGRMFKSGEAHLKANELVIRVQPDAAIYFTIMNKVPGVGMELETRDLDLQYASAFSQLIPDAYEDLLLDVFTGEKSLFIREDELAAAWDIFTPLLHEIDDTITNPDPYTFGTVGPDRANSLAAAHNVTWY